MAGFATIFADLDDAEREQVWGATLPLAERGAPPAAGRRARSSGRWSGGWRAGRRTRHARPSGASTGAPPSSGFPAQVAALDARRCGAFVETAFATTGYERRAVAARRLPDQRHPGRHADRPAAGRAARASFGLPPSAPARALSGNRSFFLTRLLRDVVFAEAGLVGADPAARAARATAGWPRPGARPGSPSWSCVTAGWAWSATGEQVGAVRAYAGSLQAFAEQAGRQ